MEEKDIINAFNDICDFFNNENILTQEDFNNICDYYNSEESIRNSDNYEVIFDDGKPYNKVYNSGESLKEGLKEFYLRNNNCREVGLYDISVYSEGEDITESQFIEDIIADILNDFKESE